VSGYGGGVILTTRRLTLVACPVEVAQALLGEGAERILGAAVPPGWPSPELTGILPLYLQELLHDPSALGWGIWIPIDRGANAVVGDAGFKGRPAPDGTVEIGYGTAPAFRGRGYATEAVQALIGWAFTQPAVEQVVAECVPENAASIRVLAKAGFRCTSAQAGSLRWARSRRI
ncbi:MAG: GNAT family protein, partial [Candidatus Bipolaricaulis anaerobius]|nr:GNAT family protein [Candidatus Bipolaricaulis anaerobius]